MFVTQKIKHIVCVDANNAIGQDNDLVLKSKADMKHFKETTIGHVLIVGWKTYQSLKCVSLPGRTLIVITKKEIQIKAPNVFVANTIEAAIKKAEEILTATQNIYIIGGGTIYQQTLPYADELVITRMPYAVERADTYYADYQATGEFVLFSSRQVYCDVLDTPFAIETWIRGTDHDRIGKK